MRGSPIINFICVLVLLLTMAGGVAMITKRGGDKEVVRETGDLTLPETTRVELRLLFSHLPERVKASRVGNSQPVIDSTPTENELMLSLTVPAQSQTEFLLDIRWPEQEAALFFTQIIIRQDGKEDEQITFTDLSNELSDTFSINTLTQ